MKSVVILGFLAVCLLGLIGKIFMWMFGDPLD